jgi:hypothetical protein
MTQCYLLREGTRASPGPGRHEYGRPASSVVARRERKARRPDDCIATIAGVTSTVWAQWRVHAELSAPYNRRLPTDDQHLAGGAVAVRRRGTRSFYGPSVARRSMLLRPADATERVRGPRVGERDGAADGRQTARVVRGVELLLRAAFIQSAANARGSCRGPRCLARIG